MRIQGAIEGCRRTGGWDGGGRYRAVIEHGGGEGFGLAGLDDCARQGVGRGRGGGCGWGSGGGGCSGVGLESGEGEGGEGEEGEVEEGEMHCGVDESVMDG